MNEHDKQQWVRDIEKSPLTIANKTGPLVVGSAILAGVATTIFMILQDKKGKQEIATAVLVGLLVFGPIFGAIAWAANRALKNIYRDRNFNSRKTTAQSSKS
ncbi:MAG: hypothetical protein WCA58_04020 [Terriglobales bacterium]